MYICMHVCMYVCIYVGMFVIKLNKTDLIKNRTYYVGHQLMTAETKELECVQDPGLPSRTHGPDSGPPCIIYDSEYS